MKDLTFACGRTVQTVGSGVKSLPTSSTISGIWEISNYRFMVVVLAILMVTTASQASAAFAGDTSIAQTLRIFGVDTRQVSSFATGAKQEPSVHFIRANQNASALALDCDLVFFTPIVSYSSSASNGGFSLTTSGEGCQINWNATSNDSWINVISPSGTATGTFPSNLSFSISENTTGAPRSGSITVTGGSTPHTLIINQAAACSFSLSPTSANLPASGGAGGFTVTTPMGCSWNAQSNDSWISIKSGNGTGNGNVSFTIQANNGPARTGSITVGDQTFTVNQANGCTFALLPTNTSIPAAGGSGSFDVTTAEGCVWTATTNDSFVNITSGSGTGSGTVSFTVQANNGAARPGTISVGNQSFTINQAGACAISLSPTGASFTAASGSGGFNVIATTGCAWTAVKNDSWISITTAATGTGNGSVAFSVEANTGPARSGSITVGDKTFTIAQANGCTYSISPASTNAPLGGGPGSFNVITGVGCGWTATSNDSFINISSGQGTGNGTVSFSVQPNNGSARTGTITLGNNTFTVNQNGVCTFSLLPTSADIAVTGGTGSFTVTAPAGCDWLAVSHDPWIAVTGAGTGSGNGTVNYSVEANTDIARSGTITVNGQTFTINQGNGCAFALSPASADIPPEGGSGSFDVTTGSGCAWRATTSSTFIHITSGSGTGNGTVAFTIDPNSGQPRIGTISIGTHVFTVNQGSSCSYSASVSKNIFTPQGGSGSITVTTSQVCPWSATTNVPWIHIKGGSGTGTGTFTFTVAPNSSTTRIGEINVAGETFTITETVGCTYDLSSNHANIRAAGGTGSFTVNTGAGCEWESSTTASWIHITSGDSSAGPGNVTFSLDANIGQARTGLVNAAGRLFVVFQAGFIPARADFDGDGLTDPSVYRPSEGKWYLLRSQLGGTVLSWGNSTDMIVPGDYDHDSIADLAVFRPQTGQWFIVRSSDSAVVVATWGTAGDKPVAADYDGDGRTDIAVFRPSTNEWFILRSSDGSGAAFNWGASGDIPVPGYYDSDSKADVAVFRPSSGTWFVIKSTGGGMAVNWGTNGDIPTPADYDGDNKDDFAVFRPSTGSWFILRSSNFLGDMFNLGTASDIPVPGDYDGDEKDDIGVYRPSTGQWLIIGSSSGTISVLWGGPADKPVPNAYINHN